MKYCPNCGTEIIFKTDICPNCKMELKETLTEKVDSSTTYGVWAIVLGVIPLLGWIVGGIGLKKAREFDNKKGQKLNIIGLIIATLCFFLNLYLVSNGYIVI